MANLSVCFDCQYIFDADQIDKCPACSSTKFDGAREVLGTQAYSLRKGQKAWFARQQLAHGHVLREMIKEIEARFQPVEDDE